MGRGFVLPVLASVLIAGCSEDEASDTEPVVRASPQAADTAVTSEEDAVDVYQQFWDAIVAAAVEPDPDAPELEEYAVDQALELARHGLEGARDSGQGMEGELFTDPEVVATSEGPDGQPVEVEIEDCQAGGDWRSVGSDEPEMDNVLVTATARHDLFEWWVVEMRIWGDDTC